MKCYGISEEGINRFGDKRFCEKEELHPMWKGDAVGYFPLHRWVEKHRGRPQKCEYKYCIYPRIGSHGRILITPKLFQWANISHKYKRELTDWIRLCPSCHTLYDSGKLNLHEPYSFGKSVSASTFKLT